MLDMPNGRSSHTVPTPRGGGVAIVGGFCAATLGLWLLNLVSSQTALAFLVGGGTIAVVGFIDDHVHVAARTRLLFHFIASFVFLYLLGIVLAVFNSGYPLVFTTGCLVILLFGMVWMLNLYNFMDGIDGLAGLEAVTVTLGMCLLYWWSNHESVALLVLFLAAAVIGFLILNFPPAKIFMGDAGSGFLGFCFAGFAVQAVFIDLNLFCAWLIMLAVFIVDATVTLVTRLLRGERVYEAHRTHAYQYAARKYNSHRAVTLALGGFNLIVLFPLAFLVVASYLNGIVGVVVVYVPLIILAIVFRAGQAESVS